MGLFLYFQKYFPVSSYESDGGKDFNYKYFETHLHVIQTDQKRKQGKQITLVCKIF